MKRPHADLIHAWADGAEIQEFDTFNDEWDDKTYPTFNKYCQYRIKPKKTVIRYKRFLYRYSDGSMAVCNYNEIFSTSEKEQERTLGIVGWIDTDWQEYEVEE